MTKEELFENIKKKKSFLCIGLDTDFDKIPDYLKELDDPIFAFNQKIIDATVNYCVAFKPNSAFYEAQGIKGLISLEKTIEYIRTKYPDQFIILDAKRGDIGNTSEMYANAAFKGQKVSAVTIAPYMGEDSVKPFLKYENKWAILLALTSNKGSEDFQTKKMAETDKFLFEEVLEKSKHWGTVDNLMYVIGATQSNFIERVRNIVPEHFLLVPGVGTQGGNLEDVVKFGINKHCGLLVNSSRSIIFADSTENFAKIAKEKAKEIQSEMEKYLEKYLK